MAKSTTYTVQGVTRQAVNTLPPHDIEAEQNILGAILIENEAIYTALEACSADDFYRPTHRIVFEAMLTLIDRREIADLLTLRDELERLKKIEDVGGPAYLAALVDLSVTSANIAFHAKIVHEKAIARRLLNVSLETTARCLTLGEDVPELVADATTKIFAVMDGLTNNAFVGMDVLAPDAYQDMEDRQRRPGGMLGIPVGWADVDHKLRGLRKGDLTVIAARPAMGKTSSALNIANHVAIREHTGVAIFSMEMSKEEIRTILLCAEAKVDSRSTPNEDEWNRLVRTTEVLRKAPIFVDDSAGLTPLELKAKAKRIVREKGVGLLIVDYMQLMESDKKQENRQQEITYISRQLKKMAKELNVSVLALSQLSRACEQRADKRPMLSDLRESGAIEQDCDVVMFIYRPEVYGIGGCEGVAEFIIGKQRKGPVGTVSMAFKPEWQRFFPVENYHTTHERPFGGREEDA